MATVVMVVVAAVVAVIVIVATVVVLGNVVEPVGTVADMVPDHNRDRGCWEW